MSLSGQPELYSETQSLEKGKEGRLEILVLHRVLCDVFLFLMAHCAVKMNSLCYSSVYTMCSQYLEVCPWDRP